MADPTSPTSKVLASLGLSRTELAAKTQQMREFLSSSVPGLPATLHHATYMAPPPILQPSKSMESVLSASANANKKRQRTTSSQAEPKAPPAPFPVPPLRNPSMTSSSSSSQTLSSSQSSITQDVFYAPPPSSAHSYTQLAAAATGSYYGPHVYQHPYMLNPVQPPRSASVSTISRPSSRPSTATARDSSSRSPRPSTSSSETGLPSSTPPRPLQIKLQSSTPPPISSSPAESEEDCTPITQRQLPLQIPMSSPAVPLTYSSPVKDEQALPFVTPKYAYPSDQKPALSYAALIGRAILASTLAPIKCLSLNDIYTYITIEFPYYQRDDVGWMNSIRHNLSLNSSFIKYKRPRKDTGKGALWGIVEEDLPCFANGGYVKKPKTGTSKRRKTKTEAPEPEPEPQAKPAKPRRTNSQPAPIPLPPSTRAVMPPIMPPPLQAQSSVSLLPPPTHPAVPFYPGFSYSTYLRPAIFPYTPPHLPHLPGSERPLPPPDSHFFPPAPQEPPCPPQYEPASQPTRPSTPAAAAAVENNVDEIPQTTQMTPSITPMTLEKLAASFLNTPSTGSAICDTPTTEHMESSVTKAAPAAPPRTKTPVAPVTPVVKTPLIPDHRYALAAAVSLSEKMEHRTTPLLLRSVQKTRSRSQSGASSNGEEASSSTLTNVSAQTLTANTNAQAEASISKLLERVEIGISPSALRTISPVLLRSSSRPTRPTTQNTAQPSGRNPLSEPSSPASPDVPLADVPRGKRKADGDLMDAFVMRDSAKKGRFTLPSLPAPTSPTRRGSSRASATAVAKSTPDLLTRVMQGRQKGGRSNNIFPRPKTPTKSHDSGDALLGPPRTPEGGARPSTPPRKLSRGTLVNLSPTRTPLSHKGVHMSPSPSLAAYKGNLNPQLYGTPFRSPGKGKNRTTSSSWDDENNAENNPNPNASANPTTPLPAPMTPSKRPLFPLPAESPAGLLRRAFDPFDPSTLLADEFERMAGEGQGGGMIGEMSPYGGGIFGGSRLYQSPSLPSPGSWRRF